MYYPVFNELRRFKLPTGYCGSCGKIKPVCQVTVERDGKRTKITSCYDCYSEDEE